MRAIRKYVVLLLSIILFSSLPLSVLAEELGGSRTTVLSNAYIKVTVDNATGRFGIRTVEGQPIRKKDQQVDLMFHGDDPETSFTTFRIDGTDYIFGNPYKFGANLFSEITPPVIVKNSDGTQQIETVWTIKGVAVKQIIMLYANTTDKVNSGNVNVRYEVVNRSGADVQLGTRMLLDTAVGGNDGPAFQVGTAYKAPLQVERRLTHNPENDSSIAEAERNLYKVPAYWVMKDKLDLSDPLATNVMAYGFNNFSEAGIHIVDEMVVGHWNRMANTKWDYTVNPNLDFTTDTNDFGSADSAVAFYWNPSTIAAGGAQSFETVYGLGEIVAPEKVFSIRYIDPVSKLAVNADSSAYANEGVFDIVAEVENLPSFQMEHSSISAELSLEGGLKLVKLDDKGAIMRDASGGVLTQASNTSSIVFRKEATPEEAAAGIQPKYKPGETVTASFKVLAKGKPWPTTPQYMLTAKSPETQAKLENVADESLKAQYAASKTNFVFLPPIGQAMKTYAYAMSPQEVYASDVKYITVNLSNIEAYNTGDAVTNPNFDLYFREVMTGLRYKVPVKESVLLQPTGNGEVGDMRITYRTGDQVDEGGIVAVDENGKPLSDLGPALPLGEYEVVIDFKGDAGGDEEAAALYDLTTAQRFTVSDNEAARLHKAGALAIVKRTVSLNTAGDTEANEAIEEAFPGYKVNGAKLAADVQTFRTAKAMLMAASKLADPEYDASSALESEEVPAYQLMAFEDEDELDAFKEELAGEDSGHDGDLKDEDGGGDEVLVEITGMINQIGSGDDAEYVVDTKTEPAIINKSVAYRGKDLVFVKGKLDIFGVKASVAGIPFLDTLSAKGDGTLSVASSGFVFHKGEWTLDFFNGFNKSLTKEEEDDGEEPEEPEDGGGEDDSQNGSLKWAVGGLGDRLNPLRQMMIEDVYFNRHSLFAAPSFSINGFGLSFNDFILRQGGISFGGNISLKIVDSEINNVIFNDEGFVGIDAKMKFRLPKSIGMLDSPEDDVASGELNIVHYVQKVEDVENTYGLQFAADMRNIGLGVEIEFKQVEDGRILPNVIGFSADLGEPGIMIAGATYLTSIRGAIRELADKIAGGSSDVPLTLEAGADISFGVEPATFFGQIDMTLKRSGIKLVGKMDFGTSSDRVEMLKEAKIAAQWMTPWFVSASAEIDVLGWDVIVGKASIFIGQNLAKNRIDFEGFVGAKVKVPDDIDVIGGLSLGGISLGVNNDKMWGSVTVLFISLGITYYFDGGIEIGTSGEGLPEGLVYMQVQDPEKGPKLIVLGEGIKPLATSWKSTEETIHPIIYRSVAEGVQVLDNGSANIGLGGIEVTNEGKTHELPMGTVDGDALVEVRYYGAAAPQLYLHDENNVPYALVYDKDGDQTIDAQANARRQTIPASMSENGAVLADAENKIYIAVPKERLTGGKWKLSADQRVDTRLLNVPKAAKLNSIELAADPSDSNRFTASWQASSVKAGDTVSLYLTKDAASSGTTTLKNGDEVANPGDAGLLIAKDLDVALNGSLTNGAAAGQTVIDVAHVGLLGDTEDIRGLLSQGDYYLRAELKSTGSFATKTTEHAFTIIDPLAPVPVSDASIQPVGNGFFELSFKPADKKPEQAAYEHSYAVDVFEQAGGQLAEYPNFSSLLLSEKELASHWNEQTGRYEGIRLGGWTATSKNASVNHNSLSGSAVTGEVKYTGLEVGRYYTVGVSTVIKAPKEADKNGNYHTAKRVDTANTLLPVPAKPQLTVTSAQGAVTNGKARTDLLSNSTAQRISVAVDQEDVEVEAIYDGRTISVTGLDHTTEGSGGTLSFDTFTTDGTYAIELRARNRHTGDFSVRMLYLTVDTIAPVLYIDQPLTGERSSSGHIQVSGITSNDAELTVNGTPITVGKNGRFTGQVPVAAEGPTAQLTFAARDHAGNSNEASVTITNGGYEVPVALVLRELPKLKPGEVKRVEAALKIPDGLDATGKAKYKETLVTDPGKLSFSTYLGEAASVSEDGTVNALAEGNAVIGASYQVDAGIALDTVALVSVAVDSSANLGQIAASTASIKGDSTSTQLIVSSAGDMTNAELVYKLWNSGENAAVPALYDDLSGWSVVPANGVIAAQKGQIIVVAKRSTSTKQCLAVSPRLTVALWTSSGGGGGGGGFAPANTAISANGKQLQAQRANDRLIVTIGAGDLKASDSGLLVKSEDRSINVYELHLDKQLWAQASAAGQPITISLPFAQLTVPAEPAAGQGEDIVVTVARNSVSEQSGFSQLAKQLQATLEGDGQGVTVQMEQGGIGINRTLPVWIAVPEGVSANDVTAVVLRDANGGWTTVPWKLELIGDKVYFKLLMTGNGSAGLLGNRKQFADVDENNWARTSIEEAAGKLFMLGRSDTQFAPDQPVTRAEYPTVLLRVLGLMNQKAVNPFADVKADDWYSQSVALGAQYGIVTGYEDGTFAPSATLSRLEAMVMAGRALKLAGIQEEATAADIAGLIGNFADGDAVPDWAKEAAALCIKQGVITGDGDALNPNGTFTRAQAAAIAIRLNELLTSRMSAINN